MSNDEIRETVPLESLDADGAVMNGFDYALQVWVVGGVVQNCEHPDRASRTCCNASKYAGQCVKYVPGHQERSENYAN